jgi:hypothetical protein
MREVLLSHLHRKLNVVLEQLHRDALTAASGAAE